MDVIDVPRRPGDQRAFISPLDHRALFEAAPPTPQSASAWAYATRLLYQGDPRGAFGLEVAFNVPAGQAPAAFRPSQAFSARLTTAVVDDIEYFASLTLTADWDAGPVIWPDVAALLPYGETAALTLQDAGAASRTWAFPAGGIETYFSLVLELTLPNLHVARQQNATTRFWTEWAEPTSATDPAPGPIQRSFVQAFSRPVVPYRLVGSTLQIGAWSDSLAGNPLGAAIETLVAGGPSLEVALSVRYAYALQDGDHGPDAPVAEIPVLLVPRRPYDGVGQIIAATTAWREATAPQALGARWVFELSLFSTLPVADDQPLLTLTRLVSTLDR